MTESYSELFESKDGCLYADKFSRDYRNAVLDSCDEVALATGKVAQILLANWEERDYVRVSPPVNYMGYTDSEGHEELLDLLDRRLGEVDAIMLGKMATLEKHYGLDSI